MAQLTFLTLKLYHMSLLPQLSLWNIAFSSAVALADLCVGLGSIHSDSVSNVHSHVPPELWQHGQRLEPAGQAHWAALKCGMVNNSTGNPWPMCFENQRINIFLFNNRVDSSQRVVGRVKSQLPTAVNSIKYSYFGFPSFPHFSVPVLLSLNGLCATTCPCLELCFRETQAKEYEDSFSENEKGVL